MLSLQVHPVFLYLFVYIVTETFIFVNLFTAVIVNNLEATHRKASNETAKDKRDTSSSESHGSATVNSLPDKESTDTTQFKDGAKTRCDKTSVHFMDSAGNDNKTR